MTKNQFITLLTKYHQRQLSADEIPVFLEATRDPVLASLMTGQLQQDLEHIDPAADAGVEREQKIWNRVAGTTFEPAVSAPPVHRIHFFKTSWFRYAAAIILVAGVAAYLWTTSKTADQTLATRPKPVQTDIAPGGERAILTLADGRTIVLDNAANGHLADQAGAGIVKLANGQIAYNLQGPAGKELLWNTMSTPRGGQYRLTLPDGTNVWLNAASSITYPVVFTGAERKVKITGEVYFEVVKNKEKAFVVDVDGGSGIQVLGTSFNVNSYTGEESVKTTLLEGSIRVKANNKTSLLKPGQQAKITEDISVSEAVDLDRVMAWKNGIFNFDDAGLKEVIPQLERWYDIQVRYEGRVPDVQFSGRMNRGVKLSTILNWFSDLGIKTRLEDKTLIVM